MRKSKETYEVKRGNTCADCIHECACQTWTHGTIHNANAQNCANYETLKDSSPYFCGFQDGKKSNTNQYVIDRLYDLINSLQDGEKGGEE